jgi:hypothetical protein
LPSDIREDGLRCPATVDQPEALWEAESRGLALGELGRSVLGLSELFQRGRSVIDVLGAGESARRLIGATADDCEGER